MSCSKTWTAARDACRAISQNSDLASIHSLAENTFVTNLFNGSAFAAWIGLSDRGVLFGGLSQGNIFFILRVVGLVWTQFQLKVYMTELLCIFVFFPERKRRCYQLFSSIIRPRFTIESNRSDDEDVYW